MEIRKRKPLSDITNAYNLIPTSTLRKLVSYSGSNSSANLKPPISILKPNSSFGGQKVGSDSSSSLNGVGTGSDASASIGSSNVNNAHAMTSRTARFQNPKFPATSITCNGDMGSKDIVYDRRQTTDKFKNERKASAMKGISTPIAKKKDKGKGIAVQFSFTPPRKIGKHCSSLEKIMENDVENLSLFSGPFEKVKGFRKGILNPYSCSHEKLENGNVNLNYFGCSKEKMEELGKGISDPSNYSFDKKKNEGKVILDLPGSYVERRKAVAKATHNSNDFLVEKTNEKLKSLNRSGYSHDKTREKGKAILPPPNMVEGSSAAVAVNCLPARRKTVKRKQDAVASSFPLLTRTQKILNDFGEAGDVKSSKSRAIAHPKFKKKQCPRAKKGDKICLPVGFIEQQRAYFKEVDEFELAEEEISHDELDE